MAFQRCRYANSPIARKTRTRGKRKRKRKGIVGKSTSQERRRKKSTRRKKYFRHQENLYRLSHLYIYQKYQYQNAQYLHYPHYAMNLNPILYTPPPPPPSYRLSSPPLPLPAQPTRRLPSTAHPSSCNPPRKAKHHSTTTIITHTHMLTFDKFLSISSRLISLHPLHPLALSLPIHLADFSLSPPFAP